MVGTSNLGSGCTKVQEHVHSHFKPEKHVSHFPGGQYRLIAATSYLDNDAKRPARKDMDTAICSNRRGFGWSWAETCARRQMKLQPSPAMGKKVNIIKYDTKNLENHTDQETYIIHPMFWHDLHITFYTVERPRTPWNYAEKVGFPVLIRQGAIKVFRLDRS